MTRRTPSSVFASLAALGFVAAIASVGAQDRLPSMPGFDQYSKMAPQISGSWTSGALSGSWAADGQSFTYARTGMSYQFDLATLKAREAGPVSSPPATGRGRQGGPPTGQGAPPSAGRGRSGGLEQQQTQMADTAVAGCPSAGAARGRQVDCEISPDGKLKAFYRDRNLWIASFDGTNEKAITTDGSEKARVKYGTGSWVYGEELDQTTAIWWSPDSTRVGYYRFDESQVKDFYLQMNQTAIQDALDVEAYPKPGQPNPIADIFVYNVAAGASTHIDIRDGKPFSNDVVGHYAYDVRWSPDGTELFVNRTNRRQNILEFVACAPATGKCRVIVREEWPTGWVENRPQMRWLADNKRFIWESERNGFSNYYLYDVSGTLLNPITSNAAFESATIVKVDEPANVMFYMARDGQNYMKLQLHRVGLDGKNDVRLTDPAFNHSVGACNAGGGGRGGGRGGFGGASSCGISPDDKYFIDVYQTHDQPPATQLVDATNGKVVAQLAKSDMTKYDEIGFKRAEQFTFKAADGKTTLFGEISFPSNFDPSKKYPTLLSVYGGPASGSNVPTENFAGPSPIAEYGFLVLSLSSRAAPGMGKRVLDSIYLKLGITEMDDMAEGVKALWDRPYFDKDRVGIFGTSYGGYTAATMILRHPDVIAAASASSPPTSWYNYDSIYTERYMWIPQENKEGYEGGNDMNFARDLRGRLLIYYGTADNNVHPSNSLQLITALQRAGKSFEVQVGPDQPHSGVNQQRMMEFFIENLVMHPERLMAPAKTAK